MDERLKETLSAMMDDQADELAVRRLLSKSDRRELRSQWRRWQRIRNLMHDDAVLSESLDVSAAVRGAVAGEVSGEGPVSAGPAPSVSRLQLWGWPAAAAIAVSLVVGFGMGAGWDATDRGSMAGNNLAAAGLVSQSTESDVPQIALQGLNDEQWDTLSRYLLEHAQHNSVGAGRGSVGYARLASVSGSGR